MRDLFVPGRKGDAEGYGSLESVERIPAWDILAQWIFPQSDHVPPAAIPVRDRFSWNHLFG